MTIASPKRFFDVPVSQIPPPQAPSAGEWDQLSAIYRSSEAPLIDVIVPVYKGYDETLRCVYSVLAAVQRTPFRLVVVDDHGPDPDLRNALRELAGRFSFELVDAGENLGFVQACNLAMSLHPERDVLLLNSDTEVHNDWLDRMYEAAYREPRIGTVTPFSSNAEICSYPRNISDNVADLGISDQRLDLLCAEVNRGELIDLPTGVGFCMLIKRSVLNHVGMFDYARFGKGYGEENDLCCRAAAAGYRNVLAADVFVRHYGGTSFGAEKRDRIEQACRVMDELHPFYFPAVDEHIRDDPAAVVRERIDVARLKLGSVAGRNILLIAHNWGGGTEQHVRNHAAELERQGFKVYLCCPTHRHDVEFSIEDSGTPEIVNIQGFDVRYDFERFGIVLRELGINHVHVQHLAGFSAIATDFFLAVFQTLRLTFDVTLHDYMTVCPRVHLFDGSGLFCGEPPRSFCESCISRDSSPFGRVNVFDWRLRHLRFLESSRNIYVPDQDVADRMGRYFPKLRFLVRPHAEPRISRHITRAKEGHGTTREVLLLGTLGEHKGLKLILEMARLCQTSGARIHFHLVGSSERNEDLEKTGAVTVHGRYTTDQLEEIVTGINPDLFFLSSILPETYSFTLSEALRLDVFPVVFDLGAPAKRLKRLGIGHLIPITKILDPSATLKELQDVEIQDISAKTADFKNGFSYPDLASDYYGFDEKSMLSPDLLDRNRSGW
ncbi:glycosyltransferase [Terrihabitans sp. B22-R8]|uniref:glycosyltransferase n=1 Tax=Terrihabitans sp. B22-R8 TaxID=3425128 RepID=UPI00403D41E7